MKLVPCQITLVYLFGMLEKEESVTEREIKHVIWNLGLKFSAYNRDVIHIALRNVVFQKWGGNPAASATLLQDDS